MSRVISTANKAIGFSHTIAEYVEHNSMIRQALFKLKLNTRDFMVTLLRFPQSFIRVWYESFANDLKIIQFNLDKNAIVTKLTIFIQVT